MTSHASVEELGRVAASHIAEALRVRLAQAEHARIVFAAAPSQNAVLDALALAPGIAWPRVTAFQMDEYIGLSPDHPQTFGSYLDWHIYSKVRPGQVHRMKPDVSDDSEAQRYGGLLSTAPIDVACLGIGENGHLAFNDPGVADFTDPAPVKVVELDGTSRSQQVNDGCFASLADVPTHAVTVTIPALTSARTLVVSVSGTRKRDAVERALFCPVSTECPASVLRRHASATLHLDLSATPDQLRRAYDLPTTEWMTTDGA